MNYRNIQAALITVLTVGSPAIADPHAFGINSGGHIYSNEKASSSYFGDDVGGLLAESSLLRLQAEKDLKKGDLDEAVRKARKAVQFDNESPDSHLTLARALTAKIYAVDFDISPDTYKECVHEWRLLRWHNELSSEQAEAGEQLRKMKLAKITAAYRQKRRQQEVQAIVLGHGKTK